MARRRVNTKFIAIVLGSAVAAGGGAVVAKRYLSHRDPQKYIAAGDAAVAAHNPVAASGDYGRAAALLPRNVPLLLKYGDSLKDAAAVTQDRSVFSAAISAWKQATEVDPGFLPAWQRLLDAQLTLLGASEDRHGATAKLYDQTRSIAQTVVKLDPKNPAVTGVPAMIDVRTWINNLPLPDLASDAGKPFDQKLTDLQRVENDLTLLRDLGGANAMYPYFLALARLQQATNALANGETDVADHRFDEADAAVVDPVKSDPKSPILTDLLLRQVDALSKLIAFDPRPPARSEYAKQRLAAMVEVQTRIPEKSPNYAFLRQHYADLIAPAQPAEAERIYRDLVAKFPTDLTAKIQLAKLLAAEPGRGEEGLAVLATAPDSPPDLMSGNLRAEMLRQLAEVRLARAAILGDELSTTSDPAAREKLTTQVNAALANLPPEVTDNWIDLRTLGQIRLNETQVHDAIQILQTSTDKFRALNPPNTIDPTTVYLLSRAYASAGQTGQAIELLKQAMSDASVAGHPQTHQLLASFYVQEGDKAHAAQEVSWLTTRFPNQPSLVPLQIAVLDPLADRDRVFGPVQANARGGRRSTRDEDPGRGSD